MADHPVIDDKVLFSTFETLSSHSHVDEDKDAQNSLVPSNKRESEYERPIENFNKVDSKSK